MAVHADHPLERKRARRFEQTFDFEHVGLPPATAVHTMLNRAAARLGRTMSCRVVDLNFDAALRVVSANLGSSVIPRQVSLAYVQTGSVKVIPLSENWAKRRFAIYFRDASDLQPAAAKMVEFLVKKGKPRPSR